MEKSSAGGSIMNLKKIIIPTAILAAVLMAFGLQNSPEHKVLFEKAKFAMETKGDLNEAIKLFSELIQKYPGEREYAAKSQLYVGLCYEKLGLKESEKAFQKVIDNYPEQAEAVKIAKEKLSILLKAKAQIEKGVAEHTITKIYESTEKLYGFISPDGKKLALVGGEGDIWLREVASGKETRLTQTPNFEYWCFWSPDSETIAYLDALNGLYVVPAKGGEPRTLIKSDSDFIKAGNFAWPTGWTSDSQMILCQVSKRGLCAIPISGGEWRDIFKLPAQHTEKDFNQLTLSPNGKFLAYESTKSGNSDIYMMPADGGNSIQITNHPAPDSRPTWSFDGKWIAFFSSRSGDNEIWVIRISPDGNPDGEPLQISRGFSLRGPLYNWTRDGKIGISLSIGVSNIFIKELKTGKETQVTNILTDERNPRWSPDGGQIAFISFREGKSNLWTIPSEGGEANKVTVNVPNKSNAIRYITRPSWLPDGKWLAFGGFFGEDQSIWTVPAKGGVSEKMKFDFDGWVECCDVSPDGAYIAFDYTGAKEGNPIKGSRYFENDIYTIPFKGGSPQRITKIEKSGLSFYSPRWAPDGKMIAFRSMDWFEYDKGKDSEEIWVCEFPGGEPKAITKKMKGFVKHLSWSPDGKTIVFSIFEKNKSQIYAVPSDGGEIKKMDIEGSNPDFSPDGKSIAYGKRLQGRFEYWLVENFLPGTQSKKQ
jgi:Tol biopolymer transport system component